MRIISSPRISPDQFARVLIDAGSPAAPEAAACYQRIVARGADPAIALAMFRHESAYGKQGAARRTKNWGNLRKSLGHARAVTGGWAWYNTWADGAEDWALLMASYAARGLTTLSQVIPIYAPSSDGNHPAAYIAAVLADVANWQAQADPWQAWGTAYPLPVEQRGFAIPAAWLADGGMLGPACSDEIAVPVGAARLFERGAIVWHRDRDEAEVYR